MNTAEVVETGHGQSIQLPAGFRFDTPMVSVRQEGEAMILEPIKPATWPDHFFDDIRIDDPAFARPPQGALPPIPSFE